MAVESYRLPPELWLIILRRATQPAHSQMSHLYQPFDTLPSPESTKAPENALDTKRTVVLVCRLWYALGVEFLYEDVRLDRSFELRHLIATSASLARCVRRIEVPYTATVTDSPYPKLVPAASLLAACPHLAVLARPGPSAATRPAELHLRFEYSAPAVAPLSGLRRIDWWHSNDASRSGGLNSLDDTLRAAAHDLEYLSVGGEMWLSLLRTAPLVLPQLQTLRTRRMNALFLRQVCRWQLPTLKHLIVDSPVADGRPTMEALWEAYGPQLRTVEFGRHVRFYVEDHIVPAVLMCPNLRELYYYIHFTAMPRFPTDALGKREDGVVHESLECIGIHSHANELLADIEWTHIEEHFSVFTGPAFPNLREVVLYGSWQQIVEDVRFRRLAGALVQRRCALLMADGTPVRVR